MNPIEEMEIARIRREYTRRDSSGLPQIIYSYLNPAFMFHMHEREWEINAMLRKEGIDLTGLTVLDVGCGNGHVLQRFLEFGVKMAVGIDLMENRLHDGKSRYSNLYLQQGDAALLPYKDERFDLVMQFTCVSSVLDPLVRQRIADEMWRVLRPGGAILFFDNRPTSVLTHLFIRILSILIPMRVDKHAMACSKLVKQPTPIKLLALADIKKLYRHGMLRYRKVCLDFNLARLASVSRWLAITLTAIPALRTSYLVIVRKHVRKNMGEA